MRADGRLEHALPWAIAALIASYLPQVTSKPLWVTGLLLASGPVTAQEEGNTLEGFKVTGLPLVSFSTDDGFGYGLRIFGTNYVEGVDPFDYQMYEEDLRRLTL